MFIFLAILIVFSADFKSANSFLKFVVLFFIIPQSCPFWHFPCAIRLFMLWRHNHDTLSFFIANMASTSGGSSKKHGGNCCVAGGPGRVSCTNTQYTPGISLHIFPSEQRDGKRRQEWIKFVRKHRPSFTPTARSVLCSTHFEESSFSRNLSISSSLGMKRKLVPDAIPTIDVAGISKSTDVKILERKRRQVCIEYWIISIVCACSTFT